MRLALRLLWSIPVRIAGAFIFVSELMQAFGLEGGLPALVNRAAPHVPDRLRQLKWPPSISDLLMAGGGLLLCLLPTLLLRPIRVALWPASRFFGKGQDLAQRELQPGELHMPRSFADQVKDRQLEVRAQPFVVIQGDGHHRSYTHHDLDGLSYAQRESLFRTDPAIRDWWRGKDIRTGDWARFRLPGGAWFTKDQLAHLKGDDWRRLPEDFLEWYLAGRRF